MTGKPIVCQACNLAFATPRLFTEHTATRAHLAKYDASARKAASHLREQVGAAVAQQVDRQIMQIVDDGYVFLLPLPHNLGNSRLHHFARDRARRKYWDRCDLFSIGIRPPATPYARARVKIDLRLELRGRPMDPANYDARCKWAIDWLVARKFIVDDSAKIIGKPVVDGRRANPKLGESPSLILTLTPESTP